MVSSNQVADSIPKEYFECSPSDYIDDLDLALAAGWLDPLPVIDSHPTTGKAMDMDMNMDVTLSPVPVFDPDTVDFLPDLSIPEPSVARFSTDEDLFPPLLSLEQEIEDSPASSPSAPSTSSTSTGKSTPTNNGSQYKCYICGMSVDAAQAAYSQIIRPAVNIAGQDVDGPPLCDACLGREEEEDRLTAEARRKTARRS